MDVVPAADAADRSRLRHREAMHLADTEYRRFADLLDALNPGEWALASCCPGWTIREIAGHVLGSMRASASLREQRRQLRAARNHDGPVADGLSADQITSTASLSADQVRQETHEIIAAAVRGRRRTPAALRAIVRIPAELPVSGTAEKWPLGYLVDHVLTRDVWMHRSDICNATGRTFYATTDHDRRVVELVVADWANRHGRPFNLTLNGPAGGSFTQGEPGAEHRSADAVDFCRALSGRTDAVPYNTEVPF